MAGIDTEENMPEQVINNDMEKSVVLLTDIDNTLYDFVDFYARAFRSMVHLLASDLGESEDDLIEDFRRLFQERGSVDQSYLIEYLKAVKNLPTERVHFLTARGRRAFDLTRQKYLRPYAEIPMVLKALHDAGVRIVAVTNAPYHYAFTRLRSIGVLDFFFGLIAWEGCEAPNEIAARKYMKIRDQAGRRLRCFRTFEKQMSKPSSLPFELVRDYFGVRGEYYALGDSVTKDLVPARVLDAKLI